ncbi:MAG: L,D-transpeptidase [Thermomicrobiales bacterium]
MMIGRMEWLAIAMARGEQKETQTVGRSTAGGQRQRFAPRFVAVIALVALLGFLLNPFGSTQGFAQDSNDNTIVPVNGDASSETTDSAAPALSAPASNWSPPSTVYIPETGHSIDGVFLDFWRANGGASMWGNPISSELTENDHIVQYYQYARFEYWPDDSDGYVVHLGNIGEALRPYVVARLPTFGDAHDKAVSQAADVVRAWWPVDAKTAEEASTDSWVYVPETGHTISSGFKSLWEATGGVQYLGNPISEEFTIHGTTYQVFERGELAWQQGSDPWLVALGQVLAKRFHISTDPIGQGNLPVYSEALFTPPPTPTPSATGEKWIDVNLSTQYLIVYQGDTVISETYVSTGRPGFETPTGTFHILVKLESQTMEGVIGGEYYNVPNVPWVMYFTDFGHALHGTYWHNNFGYQMSHGCVNLPMDFAEWLYGWAPIGTRVEIHN